MFFGMNGNHGCNKGFGGIDKHGDNNCCLLILVLMLCGGCNGFGEDNCCWNILLLLILLQCICK